MPIKLSRAVVCTLTLCAVVLAGPIAAASAADPAKVGSWGALQQYPVVPVSMGVMPDGKIVAWDQANKPPNFGSIPNNGPAMILDPDTGAITRTGNIAPRTTFCSLITSLPDGRLAVIGGGTDSGSGAISDVQIYDEDSKTFSVLGKLRSPRWYPGGTLDRSGNPVVAGGTSKGIERFDQATGVSTVLDSTLPANWYPDLIRTSDDRYVIEDVGDNATAAFGRYLLSGTTLSPISDKSYLQTRRRGIRTLVSPYKFFYNSGGTSRDSLMIDVSSGTPRYTSVAQSSYPHMTGEAVTLPTGDVLAIGGNSSGNDTKGTPVMTPEIYSVAKNSWTSMADQARRRTYHSVAALLPDGRVWSAGSSFDEVQEPNGQFFSPPYLFKQDGSGQLAARPTATDAPSSLAAGQAFSVATSNPSNIASASFVRLAATTHQLNAGQAIVPLSVTANNGRVEMTAPSVDQAPPGYYMLFLIDKSGVPSVAPIVRFQASATAALQPRVTQSSQFDVSTPASNAFDGDTSQGQGAKIAQTLEESQPWWQVDLGRTKDIAKATVRLRTDCCTDASRDLWVFSSNTPMLSTTVDGLRAQAGVSATRLQITTGSTGSVNLPAAARYVRVQSTGSSSLSLAEVTLADNKGPDVAITSPSSGTSLTAPASYTVAADASDSDGSVAKVEFYRGTTLVGTDSSAPFSAGESGLAAGSYSLTAKAFDDRGVTTTSSPVAITVAPAPSRGPVAAYAFDETSGSSATDQTGNGRTGVISGATRAAGHSGSALSFDGNDDFVRVPDHSSLDLKNTFTLEAWVMPRTLQGWKMVALKEAPGDLAYGLYASAPSGPLPSAWTQSGSVFSPNPMALNQWTHLATTYDNGTMRMYLNGALVNTQTGVPAPNQTNGDLRIGGNSVWGFETLDGKIDDVRVYDRALSGSEVATDRDTPVAPVTRPGPVLKLNFDDGSGAVARDSSGRGHDGAIKNAAWSTAGHEGGALDFDGSGWVTVPDSADLDLSSTLTIEAWVKPRTAKSWQTALLKEGNGNLTYGLYATSWNNQAASGWIGDNGAGPNGQTPLNKWTHLALTLDGGVATLYRDGVPVAVNRAAGVADLSDGPLRIGGNSIWTFEGFQGLIDQVEVWPVALSASEIAQAAGTMSSSSATALRAPACSKGSTKRHHKLTRKPCKKKRR